MSAAAGGGEPVLLPMGVQLLDAVMAIEVRAYPFPWSRGNFVDSIAAGYLTRCLVSPEGELLGYLVAMAGFREWHLLNVTVSPEHQGRGYATRATRLAMDYAFTVLNLYKLFLVVDVENTRAVAVYKKLGFTEEGILRHEFFVDGVYRDAYRMAAFQPDYLAQRG